jgi:hypothetical protein
MKTFIFNALFILVLTTLPALAGNDAPASGTWKISGDVAGNPVEATCLIKEEDTKLSGTCKSSDGVESQITGTVKEKKVEWIFDRDFNGTAITLKFSGDLDDKASKITGKINVQPFGVDGDFTAQKEAEKPKKDKEKN